MDKNSPLCVVENVSAWDYDAQLHNQLCSLFRNRFGKWSVSASASDVVSLFRKLHSITNKAHRLADSGRSSDSNSSWTNFHNLKSHQLLCFIHWFRWPFDWKSPFGYLLVFIAQFVSAFYVIQLTIFILTFFITSCWLLMTVTDDVNGTINNLNEITRSKQRDRKLKAKLSEFIQFDVKAKQ